MTTNPTTPKRWRPRFSVRTLVILVTLVCCYAACWGPTKTKGVEDVDNHVWPASHEAVSATMPLVVEIKWFGGRLYYFWFFGYVAKLPYERDVPIDNFLDPPFNHSDFGADIPAH